MSVGKSTKDNFQELVMNGNREVLLDFWAPGCGPGRMVGPIVDEIAEERKDVLGGKVNVDEEMALASQFQVMSIPTLVVLRNGQVVNRVVGARPKDAIVSLL